MEEPHFWGNSPALLLKQHIYQSSYSVGRRPGRDTRAGENPDECLSLRDGSYYSLENLYSGEWNLFFSG